MKQPDFDATDSVMLKKRERYDSEAGVSLRHILITLFLISGLFIVGGKIVPAFYEYYLLRDLANRVANEFSDLPMNEVKKRLHYEAHRSQLDLSEETFAITPTQSGYHVFVDFWEPMEFEIAGEVIPLGSWEGISLTYEVESQ
ncbi:hypothetical protein ACQZV8_15880 [Magnetococcales bacterium HHB-1]